MKERINWNTANRNRFSLVFALTTIKLSSEMPSELSFLSPLFLTARDLEIRIKILVVSLVSMSALDDFSSLPTGILVNPTESCDAIQSYMRKQNISPVQLEKKPKQTKPPQNPNPTNKTAIFLILTIIKYFVVWSSLRFWEWWCLVFCCVGVFFFLSSPNPNYGLSDNGTKYLFCPLGCSILSTLKECKKC